MTIYQFTKEPDQSFDAEIQTLRDHMDFLRSFDLYELTLYKKLQRVKWYKLTDKGAFNAAARVRGNIWTPTDWTNALQEFDQLNPIIRVVNSSSEQKQWDLAIEFTSSHPRAQSPGRYAKFLIVDEKTEKLLGVMSLGSDLLEIKGRDSWIGWTKENKIEHRRINHIANAHALVPMQPFGYNFLGGKLLATLIVSSVPAQEWERRWGDRLVGLTTTSLYGGQSQYNGIPFWKGMGETAGQITINPDDDHYEKWVKWLRQAHPEEYRGVTTREDSDVAGPPTGVRRAILNLIFKYCGIDPSQYHHGFPRGVYFCSLYQNTREFLREEISVDQLVSKVIPGVEWWRPKARARYEKLHGENRVSTEQIFYTDLADLSWKQAKRKYLSDVGR